MKQQRLDEITTRLAKLAARSPASSPPGAAAPVDTAKQDTFYSDIVREGGSVSFHRLQILVWSVLLGFVFVTSVWTDLVMSEFDATLLGLMGLSSGTYIGFKFPTAGGGNT